MCLVKVKEQEEVVVPYRVVDRRNSRRRTSHASARRESTQRYSRTEIVDHSPRPSASYIAVPAPKPLQIPAPQPVPVFVEPPPMPMPAPPPPHHSHHAPGHHGGAHYVEVSPRSSMTSSRSSSDDGGRSEYVYREREYRRERQHSPEPRYDHYRYVQPAPSESDHYGRRERSRSRAGYEDPRGSFREERTRITIEDDRHGGRRREYRN